MAKGAATWKRVKFGEITQCVNDRVDDPKSAGVDRYVGLEHLDPESLAIRRWGAPDDVESTKLRFKPGDIIFGKRRAYQRKLAVADFEGICSAHAMVLRAKPDAVVPEFLPFFMQSDLFMERAIAISVGSLSPTINWKTLAAEEFALPPQEEQRRRLLCFRGTWGNVEAARELVAAAKAMVASLRERLLDTATMVPLGSLLVSIEAGSSPSGTDKPPQASEFGVVRVSAVGREGFQPEESKALVDMTEFEPYCAVRAGSLLMTRANTPDLVGMSCIVEHDHPNLMLCDKTWRLNPASEVGVRDLLEALWTTAVRRQIKAAASGTGAAMKNISQAKLRDVLVPWPPRDNRRVAVEAIMSARAALGQARARMSLAIELHNQTLNARSTETA